MFDFFKRKPEADPVRVRQQLVERGVVPVEWGGDHEFVDVSAKARTNLDALLDTILIVADLAELKATPEGRARGAVIEAHLDKGRGPVATLAALSIWGSKVNGAGVPSRPGSTLRRSKPCSGCLTTISSRTGASVVRSSASRSSPSGTAGGRSWPLCGSAPV